nr:RNA polymerase subunit sigma-70 [uncultured Schaedlerella sp.]
MDKKILADYMDAMELIKETEDDIRKLKKRRKTVIQTNVKGSNLKFPYQEKHYQIEGTTFTYQDDKNLRLEEKLLEQRKANAENIKQQVEEWLLTVPIRMQRIIRYKIFEERTWEQAAAKIGRKATGDGIRMEFERFMKKS